MKLEVIYKGEQKAGELWRDENGYHFIYHVAFINDAHTRPISINMPKSQKEYHSDRLFPFFRVDIKRRGKQEKNLQGLGN